MRCRIHLKLILPLKLIIYQENLAQFYHKFAATTEILYENYIHLKTFQIKNAKEEEKERGKS